MPKSRGIWEQKYFKWEEFHISLVKFQEPYNILSVDADSVGTEVLVLALPFKGTLNKHDLFGFARQGENGVCQAIGRGEAIIYGSMVFMKSS